MKELVSVQYRRSVGDMWQRQRLSRAGNRVTVADKDSDMGTVYETDADMRVLASEDVLPHSDVLLRMWFIDDSYTDVGTASNPIRLQKKKDGAMVNVSFKHESISAPVQGRVLYIPLQVGSVEVFTGTSELKIANDSPSASFAIDGVNGVYSKLLTANTTVMLEVYDAEKFRIAELIFGGCRYINLSQVKAKGVYYSGIYGNKTTFRIISPLVKLDLPREIDAQVLHIGTGAGQIQAMSFAHVTGMSNKIIALPLFANGELEKTLQSMIDAHYSGVTLGISANTVSADTTSKLVYMIEQQGYTVAMAWETGNRTLSYMDPQVNDLAYVLEFEMKLRILASPYITGMIDIVTHPGYTLRYDTAADTLYFITHLSQSTVLIENIAQSGTPHTIKWETTAGTCRLTVDGTVILSMPSTDMQVSGAMQMAFGAVTVYRMRVMGNPASERTYTLDPRGYLKEQRSTGTENKYLTNIADEQILVRPMFIEPW